MFVFAFAALSLQLGERGDVHLAVLVRSALAQQSCRPRDSAIQRRGATMQIGEQGGRGARERSYQMAAAKATTISVAAHPKRSNPIIHCSFVLVAYTKGAQGHLFQLI